MHTTAVLDRAPYEGTVMLQVHIVLVKLSGIVSYNKAFSLADDLVCVGFRTTHGLR